jgi:predicted patatin/cPLA2 family phospholipase
MRVSSVVLIAAVFAIVSATIDPHPDPCIGVALQGGGDRGAYEAGVLWGFVKNSDFPGEFEYDVATGVSAGSINSAAMLMFPLGQEDAMVEFLVNSWLATSQKDVFVNWAGGYLEGLFFKPALVNNDNELGYLTNQLYTDPNQRMGVMVTMDINTAAKVAFTEQDWDDDVDFAAHAALFSSAIPTLFKYRIYDQYTFIDGGWVEGADIEDVIERCREVQPDDSKIIVDVIYCANTSIVVTDHGKYTGLEMYIRGQDIDQWRKATFLYEFTRQAYPKVNFRYFLIPSTPLPNQNVPLDFKKENLEYMINLGIQDGTREVSQPGVSAQRMLDYSKKFNHDLFYNKQVPAYSG